MQSLLAGSEVQISRCGHHYCEYCAARDEEMRCKFHKCRKLISATTLYKKADLIPRSSVRDVPSGSIEKELEDPTSSAKFDAILSYLKAIPLDITGRQPQREKALVFSQWTSCIDLLQPVLMKANLKFVRIDGSMRPNQRDQMLSKFKRDPEVCQVRLPNPVVVIIIYFGLHVMTGLLWAVGR